MRVFPRLFGGVYVALMILLGASQVGAFSGEEVSVAEDPAGQAQKQNTEVISSSSPNLRSEVALHPGE